jgi:DNA-binding NarL/FixJ family response regulator
VLDAHLPTGGLAETLAAAKAVAPATRLLVLWDDAHSLTPAAAFGADGCLAKHGSTRQLATAVRRLTGGEQAIVVAEEPPPGTALASSCGCGPDPGNASSWAARPRLVEPAQP